LIFLTNMRMLYDKFLPVRKQLGFFCRVQVKQGMRGTFVGF
jgi:hypothetical protein